LFSSQIICVLFGESYANAHSVLRIHAWAGVFVGLNNAAWRWHMAENNQKLAFFRLLAGALLNILLNYYLIPAMNIVGAAIATLISHSIATVFANVFFKETHELFYMQMRSFYRWPISFKYIYLLKYILRKHDKNLI
jgi:O-antigen/teichoic acid export membrane protein